MRTLVVQTAHLGDVVLTVPLLRALAATDRRGTLTLVTTAGGAELLAGQSWLDTVRVFGKGGAVGESGLSLVRSLARERFDVAIAAQRSFRTGSFVRASRAPLRVGFAGAAGRWAYTRKVTWDPGVHAVERYLALAGAVPGVPADVTPPSIEVLAAARERVRDLLAACGVRRGAGYVAIAPGSRWGTKRWVPAGFAAVAQSVVAAGLDVVLVGSADERELCASVAAASVAGPAPGDGAGTVATLAGRTALPELAALLADARALVANDSGTGHLAAAVGAAVVTIFGPTAPRFGYVPYGSRHRVVEHATLACRPCHPHGPERCPLGHFRCMREVPAAEVLSALDVVLGG